MLELRMERDQIIGLLQSKRAALESLGISHLGLFGSRARGDHARDSDIDILLDVPARSRFSLLDLVRVEQLVSGLTGLRANAFMERSLDEAFRRTIAPDTIAVF